MGQEVLCRVTVGDRVSDGKAYLESSELLFRGEFRLKIALSDLQAVTAEHGVLTLDYPEGTAYFELGPKAEQWASKIRNPKGLLDKLGIKAGSRVAVIDIEDADFRRQLVGRSVAASGEEGIGDAEVIVLGADQRSGLDRLPTVQACMQPNAAVWIVSPRGWADMKDVDVIAAGRAAGLVDTKVCRFSATHTALRFVVPHARRTLSPAGATAHPSRSA